MVSDIERLQMSSEHNFMCFAIACVDLINLPLIDILTYCIKPEKLYNKLSNSSSLTTGNNKLRRDQLNICCIPPPKLPNYKDFDVSLLYTLIRNLCPSVKPTQGWGIEPIDSDTQVGDDIERLRLFRNTCYGHADSTIIPDDVFEDLWTGLKSVIQRLQIYTTNWRTISYEEQLAKIESRRCTDEDRTKYKLLLEAALYVFKHADGKDDPQILITGKDKVTCGETARLESEIKISETAEPYSYSFTWCKVKGITLEVIETTCKKYEGSSDRQLVIKEVCKEDEGDYRAVLSRESNGNTFKIFSNIIHLLPEGEKPHFEEWKVTTGSEGITIHYSYGDQAKLPKVQEIKWAKNGVPLDCEGDKYKGGGLNDKSFTITSPAEDDSGTYSCTMRNAVGSETNDVTFDVPDANIPKNPTACFGSETKFDPKVVSCPLPDGVQWQKSNDGITYEYIDINEAKYYGSRLDPESPKLVITKTTFEDMLYYRLFIWNKIGESYSNATHLNVTGRAPHIWTGHEIKDIVKPCSLRLIGKVFVNDQSPTIDTIYWSKDGKKIKTLEGGDKYSEGSTEDPSLFIQNVNCHDVGTYQLTAINAVGSNESNIVLGVPQIFIKRSKNLHDDQCFTATIESIPAACNAYWKVKHKDDDLFSPIDVNAEEYKGTSNSLPCPVLVVKKTELLESQQFCIKVHNFVGSQIQVISAEEHVEIPDTSCRTKDDMSSNIFNKKGLTIRFNNLRLNLIKSLKDRDTDVHELKDSLEAITSERSLFRNINSIEDFFRQMLDKGVLNERNVIIVQYLMRQIGRPDLEEMCFEYASKSKQVLCYHENPKCQDKPRVLLHVNDDIEHFTTMESLLQTVGSIVDCTLDDIKIVRLQPDQSFIIIITMRAELISILKETDPHCLRELLQFNVDWIQIEKCVVKIVTETSSDSVCDTDGKHKQLPQIVGLTESDNVVRTKYEKEAMDFVLSYFDKLSTDRLRVGEDKTELAQQVEIPDQVFLDHHNEDISVMCSNGPVSTLSGMVSIRCTLGTNDVPTLVGLYRPLIVRCARGIELLFHLKDAIDEQGRQEVRQASRTLGDIASMECLLTHLEVSEHPQKWQMFVDALENNEYHYLADALKGQEVPKDVFIKFRKLLMEHNLEFIGQFNPTDVLPELNRRKVLNDMDKENIIAEQRAQGNMGATGVLLDRVWRRHTNWYEEFLDVLCKDYLDIVKRMDTDFYERWQLAHNRQVELPVKQLASSSEITDSKKEDSDMAPPESSPSSNRLDSFGRKSSSSIREDYMSATGDPQNTLGDRSTPPQDSIAFEPSGELTLNSFNSDSGDYDDEITHVKRRISEEQLNSLHSVQKREPEDKSIEDLGIPDTSGGHTTSFVSTTGSRSTNLRANIQAGDQENLSSVPSLSGGATSSLVGRLLQSIENCVNEDLQREGGAVPNIVGPEHPIIDTESVDENNESSDEEESIPAKPLNLRSYQMELAQAALQDKNCIIVAPTGSGKTHVAMKIIQNHREKRRRLNIPKVAFLVEQSALAEQQGKVCKEYLGCKIKVITGEKQRTESLQSLSCWIQKKDVLVITAQILVNALATGDVQIEAFSLIVFDECHHSHAKHPYNQIMAYYLDLKLEDKHKQLPQIVGLTASVGVGKAKNEEKAMDWIFSMMANMDAEELCVVEENKAELAQHVNIPDQGVVKTNSRKKNDFGRIIDGIMKAIHRWMIQSIHAKALTDQSVLKPPAECGNDQYTQWLSRLWKEGAKIVDEKARRFIHSCRVNLDMYNKALIIYTDARTSDSLAFIKDELKRWDEHQISDETDKKLRSFFEKTQGRLQTYTMDPDHNNPKLMELRRLILQAFGNDADSRGIIFVRTRDLVKAIHRWMMETDDLRHLKPVMFTGAQAKSSAGGMTKVQQIDALSLFKEGRHKIVIATSVAEEGLDIQKCNLVIRYSYVSNEIAMVQARGRGRRENGKYFVVAEQGDKTAEREELNIIREAMMNRAIELLREKFRRERRECLYIILGLQKNAKTERDLAAKNKEGFLVRQGEYVLRCQKCSKYICMSNEVRKIQNAHHACICDDIKERVLGQRLPRPQFEDVDLKCAVGKLLCRSCGSDLGNISIYKNAQFPILKIEGLLMEDNMGRRDVKKKWKSVPFLVKEITAEDISQRARGEKLIDMM